METFWYPLPFELSEHCFLSLRQLRSPLKQYTKDFV